MKGKIEEVRRLQPRKFLISGFKSDQSEREKVITAIESHRAHTIARCRMTKAKEKNAWFSSSNFACDSERAKQRQTHKKNQIFFPSPVLIVFYSTKNSIFLRPFRVFHSISRPYRCWPKGQQQKPEIYLFSPRNNSPNRKACLSRAKVLSNQSTHNIHEPPTRRKGKSFFFVLSADEKLIDCGGVKRCQTPCGRVMQLRGGDLKLYHSPRYTLNIDKFFVVYTKKKKLSLFPRFFFFASLIFRSYYTDHWTCAKWRRL